MPLVSNSAYQPVPCLFNGHLETIIPSAFRKIESVRYQRERLELADGDFLDLDWLRDGNKKVVIISHGLEGSSDRHYAKGMATFFFQQGWDALAWNCRSCSGEINRLPRFYHHGATEDLAAVIDRVIALGYSTIALVGFSMGGSLTLKYLGERGVSLHSSLKGAAVFSVPCDLGSSARELDKFNRRFYRLRFLKKLEKKIRQKALLFPTLISAQGFERIQSFREFDNRYTAPLHGFKDADDFYYRASSGNYLASIAVPALIANARNDPFLPDACYPVALAREHKYVHLEIPERGGHVGFPLFDKKENWMEVRAHEFIRSVV
jgi:uncharacterized protein